MRRRRPPRPACQDPVAGLSLVESLFARRGLGADFESYRALRAFWGAAPYLRPKARAARFAHGVLYVRVASAAVSRQVAATKQPILQAVRQEAGGAAVKDLRWVIGEVTAAPDWRDDAPPGPPPRRRLEVPREPEALAVIDQVGDAELRRRLQHLYTTACAAGRTG